MSNISLLFGSDYRIQIHEIEPLRGLWPQVLDDTVVESLTNVVTGKIFINVYQENDWMKFALLPRILSIFEKSKYKVFIMYNEISPLTTPYDIEIFLQKTIGLFPVNQSDVISFSSGGGLLQEPFHLFTLDTIARHSYGENVRIYRGHSKEILRATGYTINLLKSCISFLSIDQEKPFSKKLLFLFAKEIGLSGAELEDAAPFDEDAFIGELIKSQYEIHYMSIIDSAQEELDGLFLRIQGITERLETTKKLEMINIVAEMRKSPLVSEISYSYPEYIRDDFLSFSVTLVPVCITCVNGILPLGKLQFSLAFSTIDSELLIKYQLNRSGFTPPHVRNDTICWGGFSEAVGRCLNTRNYSRLPEIFYEWAKTYNMSSRYRALSALYSDFHISVSDDEFMTPKEAIIEDIKFLIEESSEFDVIESAPQEAIPTSTEIPAEIPENVPLVNPALEQALLEQTFTTSGVTEFIRQSQPPIPVQIEVLANIFDAVRRPTPRRNNS